MDTSKVQIPTVIRKLYIALFEFELPYGIFFCISMQILGYASSFCKCSMNVRSEFIGTQTFDDFPVVKTARIFMVV